MPLLIIALAALGIAWLILILNSGRKCLSAGFGLLGLAAGLIIGLSETPIIASIVASSFGLIGSLMPLYLNKDKQGAIPNLEIWVGPFASLLIAGLLLGIAIRVNEWLYFPPEPTIPSLRAGYLAQGFTEEQVVSIMAEQAKAIAKNAPPPPSPAPVPKPPSGVSLKSVLQSVNLDSARTALEAAEKLPEAERIAEVARLRPELTPAIEAARAEIIKEQGKTLKAGETAKNGIAIEKQIFQRLQQEIGSKK